jgi:DNA-binding NtrC family response regulator
MDGGGSDGTTCYQDERAVVDTAAGKLIIGSVASGGSRTGDIDAVIYDPSTKKSTLYKLGNLSIDDHDSPALSIRPDGQYVAVWATHRTNCNTYYSINLWYMGTTLYNGARSVNTDPNFLASTDNGQTWSYYGRLTNTPKSGYVAGYYKYWGNNTDRMDFLGTEAHPRDFDNSLYHGYVSGNKLYNSTGTVIDSSFSGPAATSMAVNINQYTTVFKTGTRINGATTKPTSASTRSGRASPATTVPRSSGRPSRRAPPWTTSGPSFPSGTPTIRRSSGSKGRIRRRSCTNSRWSARFPGNSSRARAGVAPPANELLIRSAGMPATHDPGTADSGEPTSREMQRLAGDGIYLVAFLDDGARVQRLAPNATVTVGRGTQASVRVQSPGLSRAHFAIRTDTVIVLRDLGSVNGTRLGGARLEPNIDMPVGFGTVIEAGGTFFVLRDRDPRRYWAPSSGELGEPHRGAGRSGERAEQASARIADGLERMVVEDPAMAQLYRLVGLVAQAPIPVLVTGETGVGKEVVANALHARSSRAPYSLVQVNCAALPESLLESELFGFERGAFTGAVHGKRGLIESADRGTFFLDEVGEMPLSIQSKLLRVLESGEVPRLGSLRPQKVDVRFIAATNRDLPTLVAEGAFRSDLYYRLNGITIPVPPLRERLVEIPRLAAFFLATAAERAGRRPPRLSDDALALLQRHPWPGNVRELRSAMERALALCQCEVLAARAILLEPAAPPATIAVAGAAAGHDPAGVPPRKRRGRLVRRDKDTECALIMKALEDSGGHQGRAAERLGVSRRTLINRLQEYGLSRPKKKS